MKKFFKILITLLSLIVLFVIFISVNQSSYIDIFRTWIDTEEDKGPGTELDKRAETRLHKGPDRDMHKSSDTDLEKEAGPKLDMKGNPDFRNVSDTNVDMKANTDMNKKPHVDLEMKEDNFVLLKPGKYLNKQLGTEPDMKSRTNLDDMKSNMVQHLGANNNLDKGREVQAEMKADKNVDKGQGKDVNKKPNTDKSRSIARDLDVRDVVMSSKDIILPVARKTHILIFATMRSGSSFLGQLFNHHPDVFYMFEPLYHVENPIKTQVSYINLLKNLFNCNLYSLEPYIVPHPKNHITRSLFRRGTSKAMCSPPVCNLQNPHQPYWEEKDCLTKCPYLNLTKAAEVCRQRQYVVIKTVRISEINAIRALAEDPKLNLQIIQLVRDPRGILCSRIKTFGFNGNLWEVWNKSGQKPKNLDMTKVKEICNNFYSSVSTSLKQPSWLKGRYTLVRYEDLALGPINWAEKLLTYTGLSLDRAVFSWLQSTTQGGRRRLVNQQYGTVRNSTAEAEDWRLKLPYVVAVYTQDLCRKTLEQLGYKTVNSREELINMSYTLIQDKRFFS